MKNRQFIYFYASILLVFLALPVFSSNEVPLFYEWEHKQLLREWSTFKAESPGIVKNELFNFILSNNIVLNKFADNKSISIYEIMCMILEKESLDFEITEADLKILELNIAMNLALQQANDYRYLTMELASLLYKSFTEHAQRRDEEFRKYREKELFDITEERITLEKNRELLLAKKEQSKSDLIEAKKKLKRVKQRYIKRKKKTDEEYQNKLREIEQAISVSEPRKNIRGRKISTKERLQNKLLEQSSKAIQTTTSGLKKNQAELDYQKAVSDLRFEEMYEINRLNGLIVELEFAIKYAVRELGYTEMYLRLNQDKLECHNSSQFQHIINIQGDFLELEGSMPVLSLFKAEVEEEIFITTLDSIAQDLFLTLDYFEALDDNFLAQQTLLCKQVLDVLNSTNFIMDSADGITEEHFNSFKGLLAEIYNLHQLEARKRIVANDSLKVSTPINLRLPSLTYDMDPENNGSVNEQNSDEQKSWRVFLKHDTGNLEDEIIDELKRHLENNGPYIKQGDSHDRRLRNFSRLGRKKVYHCHLGNSNVVAVWHAEEKERVITIFYMGKHPNTYNKLANRKDYSGSRF